MFLTITLKRDVMRKTILLSLFLALAFTWKGNSQAVNEPANWPNTNWTLNVIAHTGSNPQDIEADPTASDHFAYDDDDTGSGHDEIAAESPVIDISAAQSAGENYILITGDYVYNNVDNDEYLAIEYWDADASAWTLLYQFPNDDTPSAPTNNFCNGTPEHYTASLDISSFTATQLSGFKYRFIYNDDTTGGNGYNWGFCFSSPILSSTASLYEDPTFTLSEVPDCSNNQFSVDVNVTDLGGASSVTISDDQGSMSQQITAVGTVTFGPYASGTDVTITVTNDDNSNYSSSDHIQYYCPPSNDDCSGAIDLPVGQTCSNTVATNEGATDSGVTSPGCANYNGGDVWFSFTTPATLTSDQMVIIRTSSESGSNVSDAGMALYEGDCSNLSIIECDDDDGPGLFPEIRRTDLTPGNTYYVRVWEYGNDRFGQFNICVFVVDIPENDACSNAIEVASLPYNNTQDATYATNNDGFITACDDGNNNNGMNDGVWYKFTVGTANGDITIQVDPDNWNAEVAVYTGSCGSFTCVANADAGYSGTAETVTFTPTDNTTYYVNVGYYSHSYDGAEGPYTIDISGNSTLNAGELTQSDFSFYPNPTTGVIRWNASQSVNRVQVTNLTGQVLMNLDNPAGNSMDISRLPQGVYLLRVQIGDKQGTYRLIKE